MADKRINELPTSDGLTDDGLLVVYQNEKTQSITGEQIKQFTREYVETAAAGAEKNANAYTDKKIAAIPTPDVSGQIGTHNTATDAHNDIRLLVAGLTTRLNALANSDDTTLDQMAEVVAYIKANRDLIEQITTGKVSFSDIVDNLTTNVANKPLSAAQGVVLKGLVDNNAGDVKTLKSSVAAVVQAYEETADAVRAITPYVEGETLKFGRSGNA